MGTFYGMTQCSEQASVMLHYGVGSACSLLRMLTLFATWAAVLISITPLSVSSLCRGMFAGGLKEMEQEEVLIHGVSYNAMCQILHFIYTSELELSLSNVQETLVAACQLQVSLALLEQGRPIPMQGFPQCPLGSSVRVGQAGKDTRQLRETSWVDAL